MNIICIFYNVSQLHRELYWHLQKISQYVKPKKQNNKILIYFPWVCEIGHIWNRIIFYVKNLLPIQSSINLQISKVIVFSQAIITKFVKLIIKLFMHSLILSKVFNATSVIICSICFKYRIDYYIEFMPRYIWFNRIEACSTVF